MKIGEFLDCIKRADAFLEGQPVLKAITITREKAAQCVVECVHIELESNDSFMWIRVYANSRRIRACVYANSGCQTREYVA